MTDSYCWYFANSNGQTHPVGQTVPNAWGLYDMSGNVYEICREGAPVLDYSDAFRDSARASYEIAEAAAADYYALTPVTVENVQEKAELFNCAVVRYNTQFNYLDDYYIFRAALAIGDLQLDFGMTIANMQPPTGLDTDGEFAFYNTLNEAHNTYIQRAGRTYRNMLEYAYDYNICNEYVDSIYTRMKTIDSNYVYNQRYVLGGGSWSSTEISCQSESRYSVGSDYANIIPSPRVGIRLVREIGVNLLSNEYEHE